MDSLLNLKTSPVMKASERRKWFFLKADDNDKIVHIKGNRIYGRFGHWNLNSDFIPRPIQQDRQTLRSGARTDCDYEHI